MDGPPYNFCFIHNTITPIAILSILKDGYIKLGTDTPKENRVLSDGTKSIYGQIYFDDLKNTHSWGAASIIIDKSLVNDMDIEFHRGWGSLEIKNDHLLKKTDTLKTRLHKLDNIRKFLEEPKELPKILRTPTHNHGVVFNKKISIKKYAIGIICSFDDDKMVKKIQHLINKKKLPCLDRIV